MRKLIILIISIVMTLVGTTLIGVYDYKVWYNPEGKNATQVTGDYKAYLIEKTVEIKDKTNIEKTESRIKLFRQLQNYLYSEEPIYCEQIKNGNVDLFKVAVYKNIFWKVNQQNEKEFDHYRYEVFIYGVNYTEIKNMFKEMSVPEDDTIVDKAYDPKFVINFYPNADYDKDEALIVQKSGDLTYPELYDGETLVGYTMQNVLSFNLFDYDSTPQKNEDNNVYHAQSFVFYDYTYEDNGNTGLFDEGYMKIDALLETKKLDESNKGLSYTLEESLVKTKVEGFTFDEDLIKEEDYKRGFISVDGSTREQFNNVKIDGVLSYDGWVFAKYLWWQCLIAFVVCGLLMTGFYFTFTYEEKGTTKRRKNLNHKKK